MLVSMSSKESVKGFMPFPVFGDVLGRKLLKNITIASASLFH